MHQERAYFDLYSHEFKSMKLQEKIDDLGILINAGMKLSKIIANYKKDRSPYKIRAIHPSLLMYIQQMRWGTKVHHTDIFFDDLSISKLTKLLQDEIKLRFNKDKVYCSNWQQSIEDEMIKRAENDKNKFLDILFTSKFSEEFYNINRI